MQSGGFEPYKFRPYREAGGPTHRVVVDPQLPESVYASTLLVPAPFASDVYAVPAARRTSISASVDVVISVGVGCDAVSPDPKRKACFDFVRSAFRTYAYAVKGRNECSQELAFSYALALTNKLFKTFDECVAEMREDSKVNECDVQKVVQGVLCYGLNEHDFDEFCGSLITLRALNIEFKQIMIDPIVKKLHELYFGDAE